MLRLVRILCAGMTLALFSHAIPAQADLNDMDKEALNAAIKEYIEANPEILRDALMDLGRREEAARRTEALKLVRNDIGDPMMGNPDGSIVVYEFSDYNCGYCKRMFEPIRQLIEEDGDVRMVIKEFPILSQSSMVAAQAAVAAQAQGVFPQFHINMMTSRGAVSMDSIMDAAEDAGADLDRLRRDMNSDAVNAIIARTRQAATALEISGTPGLVIGDTIIPGAIGIEQLRQVIAEERAKQG